jgi:hypothetical protein
VVTGNPIVEYLVSHSALWIETQRHRYRPGSDPLPVELRSALAPHFTPATLDAARIVRVPVVENPDFFRRLDQVPMDLTNSAGITYGDTILISERFVPGAPSPSLVFHELIHVVQYSVLGIPGFASRYVRGWAENGFEYRRIPLEAQAYALQERFQEGTLGGRMAEEWVAGELEG